MGQSKGGGYQKLPINSQGQDAYINQLLQMLGPQFQQAAQGYQQFLPGGGGGEAITNQANQNFQNNTIPSILNAFGSNVKGSSGLNNALAGGAAQLNTDLASRLSELQLNAAQGLGNLSLGQGNQALSPQFAYQQKQMPFWQSAILGGIGATGNIAGAAAGNPGIAGRVFGGWQ